MSSTSDEVPSIVTATASTDAPTTLSSDASVAALTAAIVSGNRVAYERLFRSRCGLVESEAIRRLHRRHDLAADVAQETWLRIARAPRRCETGERLDAWIRRVVASAACDLLRSELARRAREDVIASDRAEARAYVDDVEVLEELNRDLRVIESLAREERAVLELKARTGATLTQLGAMLGIGRAAVDSRLRRAAVMAKSALASTTEASVQR